MNESTFPYRGILWAADTPSLLGVAMEQGSRAASGPAGVPAASYADAQAPRQPLSGAAKIIWTR